ncbi:MAG TPA: MerR family transcriptional regulator [Thermoleophilaceae bacterium]|nr:MerR family transcriptional regulator [Thermoleophilaceae bacterium]
MSADVETAERTGNGHAAEGAPATVGQKAATIGAVAKMLEREFPDISISKIRYLEEQKLLTPRRTQGGYRLFTQTDIERLRTILRLQRDEYLPLRVIRQELATGRTEPEPPPKGGAPDARPPRRAAVQIRGGAAQYELEEVLEETGADAALVKELQDFGIVKGTEVDGMTRYDESDREIVRACAQLARYGVGGRNLRVFRTSADREASLLEQILAPALRSRNAERRKEALEALESLAAITSHLKHLLLVRDLRRVAG